MQIRLNSRWSTFFPWAALILIFLVIGIFDLYTDFGKNQYCYLADAFLHGRLYFQYPLPDNAIFNGRHFWPLGVFPALLLIPLVFITGVHAPVWIIQFAFVLLCGYLVSRIARAEGYSVTDCRYWALALVGGSMFFGQAIMAWSWYFAQIIAVTLLLIAIYESLTKRRWWIIGFCMAILLMTRPISAGAVLFFAWYSQSRADDGFQFRIKALAQLFVPLLGAGFLLLWYNYARFGSPFEQGYRFQVLPEVAQKGASYGLFNLIHIPGNLYYMLMAPPALIFKDGISKVLSFPYFTYDIRGTGIFITSPWLIYLWFIRYGQQFQKVLIITISVMLIPIICYYGIGSSQFGYRYALDFFPLLLLLLMRGWQQTEKELSTRFRFLILFSAVVNVYLFFALF